jgi:predicted RNase H-like HicB family nuclease
VLRPTILSNVAFPCASPRLALTFERAGCAAPARICSGSLRNTQVKIKVVVHEADEGGYWAEVPAIPGCATQGETMEELLDNLREAIEGCLSVDVAEPDNKGRILEIAV